MFFPLWIKFVSNLMHPKTGEDENLVFCNVFVHTSKPSKALFVTNSKYVSLRHKSIIMKCYGISLLRRKLHLTV